MHHLLLACGRLTTLTEAAREDLKTCWTLKSFQKQDTLTVQDQVCRKLFFLETGLVKLYSLRSEQQFIMRFAPEHSFITVIDSFCTGKPSKYQLLALEPTTARVIDREDVTRLCGQHHCLEHLFSNLFAAAATAMMDRINDMLEDDTSTRYHQFVAAQPSLLQRVKLGELAAYLGVTQTTLSRIRAAQHLR